MFAKPTFLIDLAKCRMNILAMAEKAAYSKVELKPHFKTHQSPRIAQLYKRLGIKSVTVTSVDMAFQFADGNWEEITIAMPISIRDADRLDQLASVHNINVLFADSYSLVQVKGLIQNKVGAYIEIDFGYGRTGIQADNHTQINQCLREIETNENISFRGFYVHAGNSYNLRSPEEIEQLSQQVQKGMIALKMRYFENYPKAKLSFGDTPCCSLDSNFTLIDEMRPGNFVYYDLMQAQIGSSTEKQIAACLACPVIAVKPEVGQLVVHGGAVHLSKDRIYDKGGTEIFGKPVELRENGWGNTESKAYVSSISQEHGTITASPEWVAQFKPGDLIGILPVHSCLTANLMRDNTVYLNRN